MFKPFDRPQITSAIVLVALVFFASTDLFAHGGEPISQRFFSVGDSWGLKTNFGYMSSSFEGFVCEEAFLGGEKFSIVPLDESRWIAFGQSAIYVTEDRCTFENVKSLELVPADADGDGEYAAYVANDLDNEGIWYTSDFGQTWSRADYDFEDIQLTSIRFAAEGKAFVGGYDRTDSGAAVVLEFDAPSGTVTPLPIGEGLKYPYVLAAQGDQLAWLGRADSQTVFWGSTEDPARHELPVETWPSGAAIDSEDNVLWISGLENGKGLTVGRLVEDEVEWTELIPETTARCVGRHNDQTYVCSMRRFDEADLVVVGDDGSLTEVSDFREMRGPLECPADTPVGDICPLVWVEIDKAIRLGADAGFGDVPVPEPDAGPTDLGSTDEASDMGHSDLGMSSDPNAMDDMKSGGCSVAPASSPLAILPMVFMLIAMRRLRARKEQETL